MSNTTSDNEKPDQGQASEKPTTPRRRSQRSPKRTSGGGPDVRTRRLLALVVVVLYPFGIILAHFLLGSEATVSNILMPPLMLIIGFYFGRP